jgi:hypothetical protein
MEAAAAQPTTQSNQWLRAPAASRPADSACGLATRLLSRDCGIASRVVGPVGGELPFFDGAAAALGADAVLGGQVLGEEAVLDGLAAEDAQATGAAHGRR